MSDNVIKFRGKEPPKKPRKPLPTKLLAWIALIVALGLVYGYFALVAPGR